MGRAIEMEKQLDNLTARLSTAEDALSRVIEIVESLEEKATKVKPV